MSLVVGLLSASWNAWRTASAFSVSESENTRIRLLYECVARVPDEQARRHVNAFGNIDAKSLGCSVRESWVAPYEIADIRAGTMEFKTFGQPFNWQGTVGSGVAGFLASMLAVLSILGAVRLTRWVWGLPS